MDNIIQKVATRAVIINHEGKVLIIKESEKYKDGTQIGRWDLPGGKVNIMEDWQDGLKREVREEVGLEIEIGKPLYVGEWRPTVHNTQFQIIGVFLKCTPKNEDVKLGEDHDAFEWIDPKNHKDFDIVFEACEAINAL